MARTHYLFLEVEIVEQMLHLKIGEEISHLKMVAGLIISDHLMMGQEVPLALIRMQWRYLKRLVLQKT